MHILIEMSSFTFLGTIGLCESAELKRIPRCGKGQRSPTKLPQGRRVSEGWWGAVLSGSVNQGWGSGSHDTHLQCTQHTQNIQTQEENKYV